MRAITLLAATILLTTYAVDASAKPRFQSHAEEQNYLTIDEVQVTEVPHNQATRDAILSLTSIVPDPPPVPLPQPLPNPGSTNPGTPNPNPLPGTTLPGTTLPGTTIPGKPGGPLNPGDIISVIMGNGTVEQWVALGLKLWQVIADNKPTATVTTNRISVLPMAQQDWQQMESWKGPVAKTYVISAKNAFGATVIEHTYTIAYNYGGSHEGRGQFLANATVIPSNISVAWGFSLNSSVEIGHVVNTGLKGDAVPGVDMQIRWKMNSMIRHLEGASSYFLKGDGSINRIN